MEYFLGSIITLITIFIVTKLLKQPKNRILNNFIIHTQSRLHELTRYSISELKTEPMKTQATQHFDSRHIKVVYNGNNVYWIQDGVFYTADSVNGKVLEETKKKVDTSTMSKVELDKISFIVDILAKDEKNDSGNSGK
jgi:ligand-binding sensor domain-containing protein